MAGSKLTVEVAELGMPMEPETAVLEVAVVAITAIPFPQSKGLSIILFIS